MCCRHKAQIFTIQACVKWNLLKGCSGQGGSDHQVSQWHTSQCNHYTTTASMSLSHLNLWPVDTRPQGDSGPSTAVSVGCLHQSKTAVTAFVATPRTIHQCVKLLTSIKYEYIYGKSSWMHKRQFCCSTFWILTVSCTVLCNVTFLLLYYWHYGGCMTTFI